MQVRPCEGLRQTEPQRKKEKKKEKKKKDPGESGRDTEPAQQWGRETAAEKNSGEREEACDNLVEETGLCTQDCLETKYIFYSRDLDWIIQVK